MVAKRKPAVKSAAKRKPAKKAAKTTRTKAVAKVAKKVAKAAKKYFYRYRDAVTGYFIRAEVAARRPATTYRTRQLRASCRSNSRSG
jgi:hypothetical protein